MARTQLGHSYRGLALTGPRRSLGRAFLPSLPIMDQPQPQLTGTLTTELGEAHFAMRSGRLEYQPGGWGRAEAMKLAVDTGGWQDPVARHT